MLGKSVSRRVFIGNAFRSGLAVTAGAVILGGPQRLRATPEDGVEVPDWFVSGYLEDVSGLELTIRVIDATPSIVMVATTSESQICRYGCETSVSDLVLGDRIQAGTYVIQDGSRVANWVNANSLTGWGTVTAINGNVFTSTPEAGMAFMGPERDISVEPYTVVSTVDDERFVGTLGPLQLDDSIYYTATADSPDPTIRSAWGHASHARGYGTGGRRCQDFLVEIVNPEATLMAGRVPRSEVSNAPWLSC